MPSKIIDSNIKVLIIDDSHSDSDLVQLAVKTCGFSALIAFDGKTGIELAMKHNPQLIVLDYNLPDTNGSEVLKLLRSRVETSQKPVLVISTFDSPEVIFKSYESGADHYLKKPFTINILADKIKFLIKEQHKD